MPSAKHKHRWLYLNLVPAPFQHVGKRFYGLVLGRWPLIAFFIDDTWYDPATSIGIAVLGVIEAGLFIEHGRAETQR